MAYTGRRVVTGHTPDGRGTVLFDSVLPLLEGTQESGKESRRGASSRVLWVTEDLPAKLVDTADTATQEVPTALPSGTVLRVVRYDPGVTPRDHRTLSTDYAIILYGSIEVQLDTQIVKLEAGDTLIQRGTIHNWINNGTEPCTILFAIVGAEPISIAGQELPPKG